LFYWLKKKKIEHPHTSGDGTGYSFFVVSHYCSVRVQSGEAVKNNMVCSLEKEEEGKVVDVVKKK
jgi:transposase